MCGTLGQSLDFILFIVLQNFPCHFDTKKNSLFPVPITTQICIKYATWYCSWCFAVWSLFLNKYHKSRFESHLNQKSIKNVCVCLRPWQEWVVRQGDFLFLCNWNQHYFSNYHRRIIHDVSNLGGGCTNRVNWVGMINNESCLLVSFRPG